MDFALLQKLTQKKNGRIFFSVIFFLEKKMQNGYVLGTLEQEAFWKADFEGSKAGSGSLVHAVVVHLCKQCSCYRFKAGFFSGLSHESAVVSAVLAAASPRRVFSLHFCVPIKTSFCFICYVQKGDFGATKKCFFNVW